ncbi:MAG: hypothetical protein GF355_12050 [Candidatus Eisenbacteria bacterium]|nr:hypothetical protein [Candidatus Eisenbacteria bacterium]
MKLVEVIRAALAAGYDVTDGDGLPVHRENLDWLEARNIQVSPRGVRFTNPPRGLRSAIVAEICVRREIYHVLGPVKNIAKLQADIAALPEGGVEAGPEARASREAGRPTGPRSAFDLPGRDSAPGEAAGTGGKASIGS